MLKKLLESLEHVPPGLLKKALSGIVWEGTPESGALALTFDDGPDPNVTPAVLDVLDEIGATASFFMVGKQVQRHPEVARMVVERGHIAGNHSMTHTSMFLMKRADVECEIDDAGKAIADATGIEPLWFRPPYGMFDFTTAEIVKDRGLRMVLWTVLSGDYSDDPPEKILATVEQFIRPGAVMVFHDTPDGGSENLPDIIRNIHDNVRAADVLFRRLDELSFADSFREEPYGD